MQSDNSSAVGKIPLLIYGAGDNASRFVYDMSKRQPPLYTQYVVKGFIDDSKQGLFAGLEILGGRKDLDSLRKPDLEHILVFLLKDPKKRLEICRKLEKKGWKFASFISPYASESFVGQGVLVHNTVTFMGTDTILEDHVVIGPNSVIEGGTTLRPGTVICPFSFIGYKVSIGEGTVIYPRASILPHVTIGKGCTIGPHALIHKDMADNTKIMK